MCLSILLRSLTCDRIERIPYSSYISQSASCEAFGEETLKVCCPLYGEQKQLHLYLFSPCSHDFSKLHPWKAQKTFTVVITFLPLSTLTPKQFSLLEMVPINMLFYTVPVFFWTQKRRKSEQ